MCSCQRTPEIANVEFLVAKFAVRDFQNFLFVSGFVHHSNFGIRDTRVVGVTGVEPVTLRLSSACSNQLSYTPGPSSERWSVGA